MGLLSQDLQLALAKKFAMRSPGDQGGPMSTARQTLHAGISLYGHGIRVLE